MRQPTLETLDNFFMSSQEVAPEILWHYTSSSAFIEITKEGCIWFSDFRFLNDSSEFRFGVDIFSAQAKLLIESEPSQRRQKLLERLLEEIERSRSWMRAYVFCFSPQPDSLTHWKSYSGQNEPVAIGFNSQGVTVTVHLSPTPSSRRRP